jgi:hypothetical protein
MLVVFLYFGKGVDVVIAFAFTESLFNETSSLSMKIMIEIYEECEAGVERKKGLTRASLRCLKMIQFSKPSL